MFTSVVGIITGLLLVLCMFGSIGAALALIGWGFVHAVRKMAHVITRWRLTGVIKNRRYENWDGRII